MSNKNFDVSKIFKYYFFIRIITKYTSKLKNNNFVTYIIEIIINFVDTSCLRYPHGNTLHLRALHFLHILLLFYFFPIHILLQDLVPISFLVLFFLLYISRRLPVSELQQWLKKFREELSVSDRSTCPYNFKTSVSTCGTEIRHQTNIFPHTDLTSDTSKYCSSIILFAVSKGNSL